MSKPYFNGNFYYCHKCGLSLAYGQVACVACNEAAEWHPRYSRRWSGFWEIGAGAYAYDKLISESEFHAGLKSEEEFYERV